MICASCRKELPQAAQFCSSCGAPCPKPDPHTAETLKQITNRDDQFSQKPNDDSSVSDARLGLTLDSKYQLIERLGEGGMGSVYRARRLHIGDEVAVKLLSRDLTRDRNAIERFRREARSAAMIRHRNVVSIHDFNDADDKNHEAYIVMELVKGESLRKVLEREGRLPVDRAVLLMSDVCAGVGVAHRQGLCHRDLKPDNVIVEPPSRAGERETAKVVDFGLAKVSDAANVSALTQAGTLLGTLYYMSPEQCRGEEVDARTDVYSLGAMLYEMLSGRPPFVATNPIALITKHLSEAPPAFPQHLSVPQPIAKACLRALAKNRDERQTDAIIFADELHAALADDHRPEAVVATRPNLPVPQTRRTPSVLKWTIGMVSAFVLAVGVIGFILAMKYALYRTTVDDTLNQNRQSQAASPAATQANESHTAGSSTTASDLRGRWTGTYGPLGQAATLVIENHKGNILQGVLEQGSIRVAFNGTVASNSVHLKQTRVMSGEGWSLGEDVGTVSADGKKMSGTGKDATGEAIGVFYQWSFTRP